MRIVAGLLVLALLFLGAFFLQKRIAVDIEPAMFLPQDTMLYMEQKEGLAAMRRFEQSRLGKALAGIDYSQLLADLEVPPDISLPVQQGLEDFKEFRENKLIHELLGHRFALALLPERSWSEQDTPQEKLKKQLLLISKPQHSATALDLISSHYSGDMQMTTASYGSHTLKRFSKDDISFSAVVLGGYVLAAFEERVLREALDTYEHRDQALPQGEAFRKAGQLLPKAEQLLYLQLDQARTFAKKLILQANFPEKDQLVREIDNMAGVVTFSYGNWRNGDVQEDKMLLTTNASAANPYLQKMLTTAPQKNEALTQLRENMLLYYWANTVDLSLFWKMFQRESEKKVTTAINSVVEKSTGKTLSDILAMFTNRMQILVQKDKGGQLLPVPHVLLGFSVEQPESLAQVLNTLVAKSGITFSKGSHQGVSYQFWEQAPAANLRPLYALHQGQLFLSNSEVFFKDYIDSPGKDQALLTNPAFASIDPGFASGGNSLSYVRVDQLLDLVNDFYGWGTTFLTLQDRETAAKMKIVQERLINPLIEGAKMYQRYASRSYVEQGNIIAESKTSLLP